MLRVGLTGGIASGKSAVGEMFAALGASVIQADHISHQLMQPNEAVYLEVVRHFGSGILNPNGTVSRPKLAEAAFGSPGKGLPSRIEELNRIVHPAVIKKQLDWMKEVGRTNPKAVAIVEAALILEAGAVGDFDQVVVVTCRPEQRVQRWARRLGVSEEAARIDVERRMDAQLSDEEKIKAADFVIDNSGSLDETRKQVETIFSQMQAEA